MTLPSEVRGHHTIWIEVPDGRTVAVRYAMEGDRIICFGDDGLSGVVSLDPARRSVVRWRSGTARPAA